MDLQTFEYNFITFVNLQDHTWYIVVILPYKYSEIVTYSSVWCIKYRFTCLHKAHVWIFFFSENKNKKNLPQIHSRNIISMLHMCEYYANVKLCMYENLLHEFIANEFVYKYSFMFWRKKLFYKYCYWHLNFSIQLLLSECAHITSCSRENLFKIK